MAGIVTNVGALQVGEYLPAAQPAFSLVSSADVWIEANPKETDLAYLKPGEPAVVTIDAYPGREWKAKVTSWPCDRHGVLGAAGAERNRQLGEGGAARAGPACRQMPADAPPLRTGMSATVEIDTGERRDLGDLWTRRSSSWGCDHGRTAGSADAHEAAGSRRSGR